MAIDCPVAWHAKTEKDKPLYFQPSCVDFSCVSIVKKPTGLGLTTGAFNKLMCTAAEVTLEAPQRYQDKADAVPQSRVFGPELLDWLQALEDHLKVGLCASRDQWAPCVHRNIFGEVFARMKIATDLRVYNAEGVWDRSAKGLEPGKYCVMFSIDPWNMQGRSGMALRLYAVQKLA